jgi:hypothetical protein
VKRRVFNKKRKSLKPPPEPEPRRPGGRPITAVKARAVRQKSVRATFNPAGMAAKATMTTKKHEHTGTYKRRQRGRRARPTLCSTCGAELRSRRGSLIPHIH